MRYFRLESDKVGGPIVRPRINCNLSTHAKLAQTGESASNEFCCGCRADGGIERETTVLAPSKMIMSHIPLVIIWEV